MRLRGDGLVDGEMNDTERSRWLMVQCRDVLVFVGCDDFADCSGEG